MNYRDKFLVQMMICFVIFAAARGVAMIDNDKISEIKDTVKGYIEKNYSIDEIKETGADLVDKIVSAPAVLTGAIIQANEINEFGAPIDEKDTDEIQAVHAVSGGRVVYSGIDKEIGLCIKIQHEDKMSTYGNLDSISSVTGERVKKGEIVGTFDKNKEEEFYYQLSDSVV